MIVFNPIIDIAVILLIGVSMLCLTVFTYWRVSNRLKTSQRLFLIFSRLIATTLLIAAENAMSRNALARTLADSRSGQIRIYYLDDFLGDR